MRVSLPLAAPRGRIHVALATLCAAALLALAAAAAPQSAHAAFTITACHGAATKGEGSSLQATAQEQVWTTNVFYTSFGCGEGAATSSPVSYKSDGSGCGIASLGGGPGAEETCSSFKAGTVKAGERATETRFAASDAPLTPAQKANAEASGGPNPGVLHQIPVAVAAVAAVVHFPEGCSLEDPTQGGGNGNTSTGGPNDPGGADGSGDSASEETLRVHIPAATLENIWDGTATTWGEVVKEKFATGSKPTGALEVEEGITECKNIPVRRIVRFDGSGTTYNFKAYLGLLPGESPVGVWSKAPVVGDNNTWPVEVGTNAVPKAVPATSEPVKKEVANECNIVASGKGSICTAASGKGGPLAAAVTATDGSIGYLDLATARKEHFDVEKKKADHTYWIPLQTVNPSKLNEIGTNYVEPTAVAKAHIVGNGTALGANCTEADFRGLPNTPASDPTLGDWSSAIATGSTNTTTYPACALTYDMAFDDDAPVYGNTQLEQERARTVKDYLTAMVSTTGQSLVAGADYGLLPLPIQQIAQKGVVAIDWNKAAGSGGGPKTEPKTEPKKEETKTGGGGTVVTPPSNAFSIAGAKVKGKAIVLSLVLPDPGKVQIKATGGGVTVANVTAGVKGGNGSVTLSISKAALSKLAKIKGHKFRVKITVTFTPTGGTAASKTKTLTLTESAVVTKKASKKGKK
jgi:ABC-type phosphate transport system substrate-binding protein